MSDTGTRAEKPTTPYDELVNVDDRGRWAILTINRPEKRNAMSSDAIKRLREAFGQVQDKQVVVLTGVGPAFCAGMDLKEQAALLGRSPGSSQQVPEWTTVQSEIRSHPALFIAAVNGYALGGGSTLIHSCDLAIAAESAQIGAPEMGFGGFPSQAGPSAVKRLAPKHAAELIFLARRVSAQDAYRMAIVNKVVPDDQLLAEATEWAEQLAAFNPVAIDWGKKTVHHMENLSWDDAMDYAALASRGAAADRTAVRNGLEAFVAGHRGVGQGA
jgi:enoyl-CoA hydratase/carnithine racemase